MVQARSGATGEGDVVDRLLAEHPGGVHLHLVLDGLRAPEAQRGIVLVGRGDVGHHDVEVVQSRDRGAVTQVVALDVPLGPLDLVVELDREPQRVLHPDGVADSGGARPLGDQHHLTVTLGEEPLDALEVLGAAHPVGEVVQRGDIGLTQDQAVVGELVAAAQAQHPVVLELRVHPEQVDPELPGAREVGNAQLGVRRTDDVGWRAGQRLATRRLLAHREVPSSVPNRGTETGPRLTCTMRISL